MTETRPTTRGPFRTTTVAAVFLYAATNAASALYPIYQEQFGLRPLTVTLIYSAYVCTLIPTMLLCGPIAHVVGFRAALSTAFGFGVLGALVFAVAPGVWALFLARGLLGVAVSAATGALAATLVSLEPDNDHARASLGSTLAISIGGGCGPIVAGLFAQYLPMPTRLIFILLVAAIALGALWFLRLPPRLGLTGVTWRPRPPQIPVEIRRPFAIASTAAFIVWAVLAVFLAMVPSYLREATGSTSIALSATAAGLVLVVGGVVQIVAPRHDPRTDERIGVAIICAAVGLLVAGGLTHSAILIVVASVTAGIGQGVGFLGATREVNELSSHRADHAGVFAAYGVAAYCGSGIPIIGVGIVGNLAGTTTAVVAFGSAILLAAGVWFVLSRR